MATYFALQTSELQAKASFEVQSERVKELITQRIQIYIAALEHVRAFFVTRPDVTAAEFHQFITSSNLATDYPGIQGIGFSKVLLESELDAYVRSQRRQGAQNFSVWPPGKREVYMPIVLIEPLDWRNQRALGYDMFSEATRNEAMGKARDTGNPAVSKKVYLIQESLQDRQNGFLLYVPIYRHDLPSNTVEERRRALMGYIYAPFRSGDFFQGIFKTNTDDVGTANHIAIYADTTPGLESLLTGIGHEDPAQRGSSLSHPFRKTIALPFADQMWTLVIEASPFRLKDRLPGLLILIFGLSASILGFRYLLQKQKDAENLRNKLEESRRSVQMREDILAIVSHDLRNPLAAIQMGAALMARLLPQTQGSHVDTLQRQVENLTRSAQRMNRLIEDLLDFIRLEHGNLAIRPTTVSSGEILEECAQTLRPLIEDAGLKLEIITTKEKAHLKCDQGRIIQVVSNLVGNSIKFTPKGGTIRLRREVRDSCVLFEVSDTGRGIPEEALPRIFDRYWQKDQLSRRGMGLGLFIVRGIIEAHQGKIEITSKLEFGTQVRFFLSRAADTPKPTSDPLPVLPLKPENAVSRAQL
jgi:signal transduction histidine kinase